MTYKAIVAKVHTRPHPNADKLQLGSAAGNQVVVGLEIEDGTLGVFFPTDGVLSNDYCVYNDLYPKFDPLTNKRIGGGFFDAKRPRVRSQNFRGEKSDGYWAPLDSLSYTGVDLNVLVEGYEFDELNGQIVCEKFFTKATLNAMANGAKFKKKNIMFPEHVDTKQFRYEVDDIPSGSLITITEKVHGTSGRYGNVQIAIDPATGWRKVLAIMTHRHDLLTTQYRWGFIAGTRRVILGDVEKDLDGGFYGDHGFRHNVTETFRNYLHKGEVVYGELVGHVTHGQPIMRQSTLGAGMPDVTKQYGDDMVYHYGCGTEECKFIVYRITQNNEDGEVHELSWSQIKNRCDQLGLPYVPEMNEQFITSGKPEDLKWLKDLVDGMMEGPSTLDPRHIREGVVVRVDTPKGETKFLKAKSWTFGMLEGYIKSDDNYVDIEEVS